MRNIFNEGIIRGKYLENDYYLDLIRNEHQIILDNNIVIELICKEKIRAFLIIKKYNRKLYLQSHQYDIISKKELGFYEQCHDIILKNYINIETELSFFTKLRYEKKCDLLEIKILNILNDNERKYEIKKINLKGSLIHLDENINIGMTSNNIYLYDNLFNIVKTLLSNEKGDNFYDCFKINKNTFIYSYERENNLYVASILDYELNSFLIRNCGNLCYKYLEKKRY